MNFARSANDIPPLLPPRPPLCTPRDSADAGWVTLPLVILGVYLLFAVAVFLKIGATYYGKDE